MSGIARAEAIRRAAGARRVVVFTGAGVSKESGLGTFRDADGAWARFRPEDLATPEAFARDPARVAGWYRERFRQAEAAAPNPAHATIAIWERRFPSLVVVTQNVDGLHQRAGSRDVLELHGSLARWRCVGCGADVAALELPEGLPIRCACGGLLRPGVVWFGEPLPEQVFARAARESRQADLFVVVGTSATVWPAAGLVEVAAAAGALVVDANPEETPMSRLAALSLRGPAGEQLPRFAAEIESWRSRA